MTPSIRQLTSACTWLAALLLAPVLRAGDPTPSAQYSVVFDAAWSAASHPTAFPAAAHWSPLIGGTHDGSVVFWTEGGLASPGIELMAELGATSPLDDEIGTAIGNGQAGEVFTGPGIFPSPGSASAAFTATQQHSRVTLVSMIAPSPDWFVGVSGLELFEGGDWVDSKVVSLLPWDAGNDDGTTFLSANADSDPADPIAPITGFPFSSGVPLGTFTFTRTDGGPWSDLGGALAGTGGEPQLVGTGEPVVGQTVTLALSDALADSTTTLIVGLGTLHAPFKGGTLVPQPDLLLVGLPIDAAGELLLSGTWPPGLPAGTSVVTQHWIVDAVGPAGLSASNAVCALTP